MLNLPTIFFVWLWDCLRRHRASTKIGFHEIIQTTVVLWHFLWWQPPEQHYNVEPERGNAQTSKYFAVTRYNF